MIFLHYDFYEEDPTVASIAALSPLTLLKHPSIICRSRTPKNSSGLTFQVCIKEGGDFGKSILKEDGKITIGLWNILSPIPTNGHRRFQGRSLCELAQTTWEKDQGFPGS